MELSAWNVAVPTGKVREFDIFWMESGHPV